MTVKKSKRGLLLVVGACVVVGDVSQGKMSKMDTC